MELDGYVASVIDNKLVIVRLDTGKEIFLPLNGDEALTPGDTVHLNVAFGF